MPDLFAGDAKPLILRDYQEAGLEAAREHFRQGRRRVLLCSPTGSGKTIMALGLMAAAMRAGSRSAFLTDRNALIDQTSAAMDLYGLDHGVMQGEHWRCRPGALVQLVSPQTLGRRMGRGGYVEHHLRDLRFVLIDEAHTLYRSTIDWLDTLPDSIAVLGLTATPFTRGLAQHFQACVNVITTDALISRELLVRPLVYAAIEADTSAVAVKSTGEWDDAGLEREGVRIVGDVVSEYIRRTGEHFGGPAKTIVFSSTVAHGEEICRAFAGVGLNFQNISYRDDEAERKAKIAEFRKPESAITGLVSCDALAKGFDVEDIRVCILCRPLRKSLTTHIQQIGRVMRPSPGAGKDKALVLDHTGNCLRFFGDATEFWARGVDTLDESAEKDRAARSSVTEKERKDLICFGCSAIIPPGALACLACGRERPRKPAAVRTVAGTTQLLTMNAASGRNFDFANHPILYDREFAFQSFLAFTVHRKRGDVEAARRWAAGIYKGVYGHWPPRTFDDLPCDPSLMTIEVERFCRREMARFAKSRASHAA